MPKGKRKYLSNTDLVKAAGIAARMATTERNSNPLYVKALVEIAEILEVAAAMSKLTELRNAVQREVKGGESS